MEKVTFTFPSYDSLWLFKDKTKAINIKITPKKNSISGIFGKQDVELAVNQFHAVQMNQNSYQH